MDKIGKLLLKYISNIKEFEKKEFLNESVKYNVNVNFCSEYDIMRINYLLKKTTNIEIINSIKLSSIYGYTIYKLLVLENITGEYKDNCCEMLLDITNSVRKYITMETDYEELINMLTNIVNKLKISEEENNYILKEFDKYNIYINGII